MSDDVVELRVHGVSGARAEDILDFPIIVRVAGDGRAGFYRPRPGPGATSGPPGVTEEAYHWSGLTAGTAVRTLSLLLLLPFMFSNLTIWVRPPARGSGATVKALCHLLAATVTVMFVLSIVGASADLVGWQCASYHPCVAGRRYLSWFSLLPIGPRLALLAVVPFAAIRFIWWLGSRSARAYEAFEGMSERPGGDTLDSPCFWNREAAVGRLRSIHVVIAFGTVDAALLVALAPRADPAIGVALLAAVGALIVTCVALLCVPALSDPGRERAPARVTRPLRAASTGLTVLVLAYAAASHGSEPMTGRLPGFAAAVAWLFVAQAGLLAALAVVALWHRARVPFPAGVFVGGLAAPAFGALAVSLEAAFAAALNNRVADVLDRGMIPSPTRPLPPGAPPLLPPTAFRWAALGAIVAILVVALSSLFTSRFTRRRRARAAERIVRRDFPDAPPEAEPRIRAVSQVITRSRIAEELNLLVIIFFVLSLLSIVLAALDVAGLGPVRITAQLAGPTEGIVRIVAYLTDLGTYFIGLVALGLVILGVLAYRSAETRRLIGVLWDLGTFWPRVAHPFAPPCYAERAVPELARRITGLVGQGDSVLLSGHSHGSVLAAATVLQLPPDIRRRVALLTYGSPLRRLYARLSPAYFSPEVLCDVGARVGWRWRNLWRDTDPVGGAIFSAHRVDERPTVPGPPGEVDERLRDPHGLVVEPPDTVPPPLRRHWPYHTDERYVAAVGELAARLDTARP